MMNKIAVVAKKHRVGTDAINGVNILRVTQLGSGACSHPGKQLTRRAVRALRRTVELAPGRPVFLMIKCNPTKASQLQRSTQ